MKLDFDDGSFLSIDPVAENEEEITLSMCGLTGRKATMVSSRLTYEDVSDIIEFLQQWQKNVED